MSGESPGSWGSAGSGEAAAGREASTFIEVARLHDRELRMLAYRMLHDRTAMDDVMQDAYVKAFRGFSGFRGEAQARTWIYRIVYNACLDRLRSDKRRREVPLDRLAGAESGAAGPGRGADPCGDGCAAAYRGPRTSDLAALEAESVVQRTDLATALASLPEDQRTAVLLVDAAGFSYEEAAEVLGVRPGTIGSRLHHARSVLRATLTEGRDL
jgi:RNA polymerase sigma-70 factor (ECF subfamily)